MDALAGHAKEHAHGLPRNHIAPVTLPVTSEPGYRQSRDERHLLLW